MASMAGEEVEYDSDPEEVKRSLGMRRREAASDDEEVEEDAESDQPKMDRRAPIHSDESDGQGAAADYEDDEDEVDIEDEEEEELEEEMFNEQDGYVDEEEMDGLRKEEIQASEGKGVEGIDAAVDGMRNVEGVVDPNQEGEEGEEEEKKENEPFAVPTAGAFYMHDDRFRENIGGRHRRMHVGRKLWESKDDRKWGHDKYEEIELQEKQYEEGRRPSRGRYRGRSRNHGPERSYPRSRSRTFNKSSSENQMAKSVRGRGPRRYEPTFKRSSQATSTYSKQSGRLLGESPQTNSTPAANTESVSGPAKKHGFASSLNFASPPFYPSGSSNKDVNWTQKRDLQAGNVGRNNKPSTSVREANYSVSHDNPLRGKNAVEALGMEKLHIDDSTLPAAGRPMSTLPMHASVMTPVNTGQSTNPRVQGSGLTMSGQMSYQQAPVQVQAKRVSAATQLQAVKQSPVQSKAQAYVQPPAQQLNQRPGTGSQASSPPRTATLANSYESQEVESSSETSKSIGALVGKVKGSVQGTGKGSFLYGGAQVMGTIGNMTVNHGDPNFPAFLPVMQFGGQHPRGIGVPAVGMAFPGYVGQPQSGNSEMTWLPVLTGAAEALGTTYCPPYLAVDGSYHARPSGQPSSTGSSSKESNSSKPNNEWSSQRPEAVTDEFGQRPNNPNKQPRRYSEMSFSK